MILHRESLEQSFRFGGSLLPWKTEIVPQCGDQNPMHLLFADIQTNNEV